MAATSTTSSNSFRVGPGVAPEADLYAVRVFGCEGSTDVVVLAVAAGVMAEEGHVFHRSDNGVWLTAVVPPQHLAAKRTNP